MGGSMLGRFSALVRSKVVTLITAETKQEIKSLAVEYEGGRASKPVLSPSKRKGNLVSFMNIIHSHYDKII